jgi:general secretion pathway protein E
MYPQDYRYTNDHEWIHPEGDKGRVGITEIMPMTDPLRSLVMKHATAAELRAEAVREGMLTMYEDGLRKAVRGVTTLEEVLRVTREG